MLFVLMVITMQNNLINANLRLNGLSNLTHPLMKNQMTNFWIRHFELDNNYLF